VQIEGVSKTGDIRSSASCIKTSVACRSCTPGTRQRLLAGIDRRRESWAGAAGVHGGRYGWCSCFRRLLRGMAQRNASTASIQGCCLASARPPWTLFSPLLAWGGDVHDRLRQATASLLWARPLPRLPSTCMHGRVRLLGRSNPPPVPISPSSQHTTQTLFLDNITPPPAPLDCTSLQSLRPHLQSSTLSPRSCFLSQQVTLLNLFPRRRFCFCCWVRANCCSPDRSLPETSAHLQAHLRHLARPSSLLPALAFSHPPPNSPRRLLRYRLAGIHLLCSTRPVASTPLILLSTLVPQPNPSPVPAPLRF
jgi:hypothetical protein